MEPDVVPFVWRLCKGRGVPKLPAGQFMGVGVTPALRSDNPAPDPKISLPAHPLFAPTVYVVRSE